MRITPRIALRITLTALALLALVGCSMIDEDNRLLLNQTDKIIQPKSVPARVALAPLAVPAATAIVATDATLIHPINSIPKAWDDTYELYWKPRNYDMLRKSLLFVPIVALTPPTFIGDLTLRALFPID